MQIHKAVITAAGEGQRRLPLQTLVDRDGASRTVLAILVNEILRARIDQICIVVRPGDQSAYRDAVPEHRDVLQFVEQPEPLGYGDAIYRAREFTAGEAFLHLVADHLYVGGKNGGCAVELVQLAESEACCVSAVQATHESLLTSFGTVGGQPVPRRSGLFRIDTVLEKPTPTVAEQKLIVPGLRSGYYLAFFGMHVLTPGVMDILGELLQSAPGARITLSEALAILAKKEKYLALQVHAVRYDLAATYGLLTSQVALALAGQDRQEVLSLLATMLANDQLRGRELQNA
jgi:UTP--glucose-1-phosphate uridylyltransferase